ncbi:MAG: spermidine/putrescine ABC transporter substrate-binding protein [Clostridia bacterium]|nr:spermidine/putrescine ABC transporter substrate-binding protein [Clostridia bacterium]
MRKFALILCILIAFSACAMGSASASAEELTVFNWFDYIDPAVIDLFEEETGITVKYVNFTTNEEMYTKLEAGAGTYDVIFPSEYMIERMIAHDMLEELDLSAMPNFANVMDRLKDPSYDPGNKYSVPYMWGTLGYLYNTEMVDEELTSWGALFDEKYAGNVIMMNSMRDSIGLALKYLGYSMNTRNEAELNEAKDLLIKQKQDKIQCGYLLDETKDKMVGGEAAIGVVYSGDAQYAIEKNENLVYVVPEEGSNIWVDGMCIPKGSKNVEGAMKFIDFMCREDVAAMNFDYIYYCSPIQAVVDGLDEEEAAQSTINPSEDVVSRCEYFNDVEDVMNLYENVWMEIRLAR